MNFADKYFDRFISQEKKLNSIPDENLKIIITIPCYNEPNLLRSLLSISNCEPTNCSVEIITVINFSELTSEKIKLESRQLYEEMLLKIDNLNTEKTKFHFILEENIADKFAGVGTARKIAMDESLRRFSILNKPDGIIVGFDADSEVEPSYLQGIENFFLKYPKTNACSIHFEHPIEGNEFSQIIYDSIISYELHLRYYINALIFTGFPYAFQTIGSAFAVRADVYAKQGGMNRKKAGEDFYFLQKVIPLGNFKEISTTKVIPSPRTSDRVPFGTGAAVFKMISSGQKNFLTYNFLSFCILKTFFEQINNFFYRTEYKSAEKSLEIFLEKNNFIQDLDKILKNSPNITIFRKRFFDWFDAFRIIKYLNFSHENNYFTKETPDVEINKIFANTKEIINCKSSKELLLEIRKFDLKRKR